MKKEYGLKFLCLTLFFALVIQFVNYTKEVDSLNQQIINQGHTIEYFKCVTENEPSACVQTFKYVLNPEE